MSVKEVTAAVVGSRTVETEVLLDRDTLDTLDPQTSPQVEEWAIRSAQAAALVLARDVEAAFDPAAPETSATLATLPDVIGNARQHLRRLTLDLVVSPATLSRLVGSVGKKVKEALNGGAIIPLSHLTVGQAWLLPHHGGEVVVETVDAPDLGWDTVGDDVRLFAREEFIVVRRRPLPVRRLLIECGCCGCGCCRCCRCCRCCECCVKAP
ncbi:MAG TPA: hypothetical protein VM938_09000 [Acidimicrobiales bacterium]|nr:hypothetical protein [Acidimicrobiales bacterium]